MMNRGKLMVEASKRKLKEREASTSDPLSDLDDSDLDPNYIVNSNEEGTSNSSESSSDDESLVHADNSIKKGSVLQKRKSIKAARAKGDSYRSHAGKMVQGKKFVRIEECRNNCQQFISEQFQKTLFDTFWLIESKNKKIQYLSNLIEIKDKLRTCKKQVSPCKQRNRTHSTDYFIEKNGLKRKVCQKCFLRIFDVTPKFIRGIRSKKLQSDAGNILEDNRGNQRNSSSVSEEEIKIIKEHIYSFPNYESHYARNRTSHIYLGNDLSIEKMYELYKEANPSNHRSLSTYKRIFYKTGLKFKQPKVDTCSTCDILKLQLFQLTQDKESTNEVVAKQKKHHANVELAYEEKRTDKEDSKAGNKIKTFAFDLQQCLRTPALSSNVAFYKRPLWTFNLTVHNLADNKATCYMWDECTGGRGANQIASCIYHFIQGLSRETEEIIMYSDSCSGQNKNSYISVMFFIVLEVCPWISKITHKFLVPGHTHMECDSDHALIEKMKKKTDIKINVPYDWYQLVRTVGKKNPFKVIEMTQNDFYDFSALLKGPLIKRSSNDEKLPFRWNEVVKCMYEKKFPKQMLYAVDYGKDALFKKLSFVRRGQPPILKNELKQQYSGLIPISEEKKKDLISLFPLIDKRFHSFYENLPCRGYNTAEIHPDFSEFYEDN